MNVLEKILEEMDKKRESLIDKSDDEPELCDVEDWYDEGVDSGKIKAYCDAADIVRSHMDEITKDDWIPVSEELPPFGEKLQATILHHEWIADYDSSWVPEEERTYHQEYTEVCEIYPMGGMWFYACKEDEYQRDIAYIKPKKDLGNPISEIIAWRPLPEPYKGGE